MATFLPSGQALIGIASRGAPVIQSLVVWLFEGEAQAIRPSRESSRVVARMAPSHSTLLHLARKLGQAAGPAALLADAGQADRPALLAAEASAGDAPVTQSGCIAVDRPAVPAVGAGDLDGKLVAGEVAEGRAGGGQGHFSLGGMPAGPRQQRVVSIHFGPYCA